MLSGCVSGKVCMAVEDLRAELLEFDGIAVSILSEARARHRDDEGFLDGLVALFADENSTVADGATWILKAELEDGTVLPRVATEALITSLDTLSSWPSVLHVFQIVDRLDLNMDQAGRVILRAKTFTGHKRPFLRAWSMHAVVVLGRRFPEFSQDAEAALTCGEADAAASVRARARRLRQ